MTLSMVLGGLLGGWLAADATAFAQILVSQPLVGGTLAGLIWGDPVTGAQIGAMLQLFALARLPLGGRTPDDFASAGVVGPAVAILIDRTVLFVGPTLVLVIGTVIGLSIALLGRPLIHWLRTRNEALVHWAEKEVRAGRPQALDWSHWLGVGHAFALGIFVTLTGIAVGTLVVSSALAFDTVGISRAADASEPLFWGLGVGLAVRQFVHFRKGSGAVFLAVLAIFLAIRLAASP